MIIFKRIYAVLITLLLMIFTIIDIVTSFPQFILFGKFLMLFDWFKVYVNKYMVKNDFKLEIDGDSRHSI